MAKFKTALPFQGNHGVVLHCSLGASPGARLVHAHLDRIIMMIIIILSLFLMLRNHEREAAL